MKKAIVYTTDWCGSCRLAIRWLIHHGFEVEEKIPEESPFPITTLPTIVIDDKIFYGFQPKKMAKLLRI